MQGNISSQKVISSKQLTGNDLIRFQEEFDEKKRYTATAWLFFVFLGHFGAHRFYLKDKNNGLLHIILILLTFVLCTLSSLLFQLTLYDFWLDTLVISLIPMLINLILWFIDMFRLPKLIYKANKQIEKEILSKIFN